MNKGIIFSMDAALALVVVILLAASLPYHYYAGEEQGSAFEKLQDKARDRAIVGFYKGLEGQETISNEAKIGKCVAVYTIDPNNDLGQRDEDTKSFCEEIK